MTVSRELNTQWQSIRLSAILLKVILPNAGHWSVIIIVLILLSVIRLNVAAPLKLNFLLIFVEILLQNYWTSTYHYFCLKLTPLSGKAQNTLSVIKLSLILLGVILVNVILLICKTLLNVILLDGILLSGFLLSVIMLPHILLMVILLKVILISIIMLSVILFSNIPLNGILHTVILKGVALFVFKPFDVSLQCVF